MDLGCKITDSQHSKIQRHDPWELGALLAFLTAAAAGLTLRRLFLFLSIGYQRGNAINPNILGWIWLAFNLDTKVFGELSRYQKKEEEEDKCPGPGSDNCVRSTYLYELALPCLLTFY